MPFALPTIPLWLPKLLRSRWTHYAVLVLVCGLLLVRGNHYERDRDAWKDTAGRWESAQQAQEAAYVAAQAAAKVKAIAAVLATETKYKEIADAAQSRHTASLDAALQRAGTYAAVNRVRRAQAAPGAGGRSAAATPHDSPSRDDRSGREAELVAITRRDLDVCTINTARLDTIVNVVVPDWIKDGLAIPVAEFGRELPAVNE